MGANITFERTHAGVGLSLYATGAAWRAYRETDAPVGLINTLYPPKLDRYGKRLARGTTWLLMAACDSGMWDLTTLDEYIIGIVSSQSVAQQAFFYQWNPIHMSRLAGAFDVAVDDPRLVSVHNLKRTVDAVAYLAGDTSGMLTALAPLWFEICDAALATPTVVH